MQIKSVIQSAIHATGAAVYIGAVASFITFMGNVSAMNKFPVLGVMSFLLLFVISAAVMGILIFGLPIMRFIENKKKESIALLFLTVGWLAFYLILALIIAVVL